MVIYAESSAVVSWLFLESRAAETRKTLDSAELVVASELTRLECARTIHRAASLRLVSQAQVATLLADLESAVETWDTLEVRERVISIASEPFPVEPIRALDAIHLASALVAREVWPEITLLSLDHRIRANAVALNYSVLPERL